MRSAGVLVLMVAACTADTTTSGPGGGGSGGAGGAGVGGSAGAAPLEQGHCSGVAPSQAYYAAQAEECAALGENLLPYNCGPKPAAGCVELQHGGFVGDYCCPGCFPLGGCQEDFPYTVVSDQCDGEPMICPSGYPPSFGGCPQMNTESGIIPACDHEAASEPLDVWCCSE